jgi:hypothetical protein
MIILGRKKILKLLTVFAIFLIFVHTTILILYYMIGDPKKFDFVQMFDLDMEANIPTLFSSLLFMINAFFFWAIAQSSDLKERRYWNGLAVIFAFLSFDESAKIHENIGDLTERFIHTGGVFYYPWVISYSILVLILGLVYLKFFLQMPRSIFYRFMLAAAIFLTGAIGFELLGAQEAEMYGTSSPLYSIYYTIEESLEMFGLIYLSGILLEMLEGKKIRFDR